MYWCIGALQYVDGHCDQPPTFVKEQEEFDTKSGSRAKRDGRGCLRVGEQKFSARSPQNTTASSHCIRQMDNFHDQLRSAMTIDGHGAGSGVVENVYRWIACTIYCDGQWPSMDSVHNVLKADDQCLPASPVAW